MDSFHPLSNQMLVPAVEEAVRKLWLASDLPIAALSRLKLSGDADSAINSSFRLGVAAQTSIGLSGLAATQFYTLRTGVEQDVRIDARHAVIQFHSEAWYTIDGKLPEGDVWDNIAGLYRTKDNSIVRIHTNFPHHRREILSILNLSDDRPRARAEVAQALMKWNAVDFETEAASKGMCATAMRSFDEWDQHPQATALRDTPPVMLVKIGDAPKRQNTGTPTCPLDGIRVLDLSRVLAGPVGGRVLAAHGADVLLVTSPKLPALPLLDIETSLGKRTTQLDLTLPADRDQLTNLAKETDVFLQAYRPGGLEEKGFGARNLASLRPGIICANLTAWGWDGPWKDRRGFDSLVQTATGFNVAEGDAFRSFEGTQGPPEPKTLPMQALDHAAGYLLAFGVNAALCKTIEEGGSWEVRVSLAAVAQWVRSLGRLRPEDGFGKGVPFPARVLPQDPQIAALSVTWQQAIDNGVAREMTAIRQAALLSETPVREGRSSGAPMILNAHSPVWLRR